MTLSDRFDVTFQNNCYTLEVELDFRVESGVSGDRYNPPEPCEVTLAAWRAIEIRDESDVAVPEETFRAIESSIRADKRGVLEDAFLDAGYEAANDGQAEDDNGPDEDW